ncbi:MAG: hypothetical protein ACI9HK_001989, partial [Pirellulaceae bacterium]
DVQWDSLSVVPGERIRLNIHFVPKVAGKLNAITAVLKGVESVESGSGTRRTTHTHVLEERKVTLYQEGGLTIGEPIDIACELPIPQTDAYTFFAADNKIIWTVTIRIDIPLWPDWVVAQVIRVRPYKIERSEIGPNFDGLEPRDKFEAAGIPPEKKIFPPPTGGSDRWDSSPAKGQEANEAKPSIVKRIGDALQHGKPAKIGAPIVCLLRELNNSTGFSTDRNAILAKYANQELVVTLDTERVERTFGYGKDDRYRDGRTVIGKVAETDFEVSVQCNEMSNEELDKLAAGDSMSINCIAQDWDSLYKRLEMIEAD